MTELKQRFRGLGLKAFGADWQSALTRRFNEDHPGDKSINLRTIQRWASFDNPAEPKDFIIKYLERLVGPHATLPRFIFGELTEDYDKQYIIHTAGPRFIGRLVFIDDNDEVIGSPANTLSGIVFKGSDWCVCEIAWIDTPRAVGDFMRSMVNDLDKAIEDFS